MGILQHLLIILVPISLPNMIISLFQLHQMSLLAVTWFVGPISIYLNFGGLEVSITPYRAHQKKDNIGNRFPLCPAFLNRLSILTRSQKSRFHKPVEPSSSSNFLVRFSPCDA